MVAAGTLSSTLWICELVQSRAAGCRKAHGLPFGMKPVQPQAFSSAAPVLTSASFSCNAAKLFFFFTSAWTPAGWDRMKPLLLMQFPSSVATISDTVSSEKQALRASVYEKQIKVKAQLFKNEICWWDLSVTSSAWKWFLTAIWRHFPNVCFYCMASVCHVGLLLSFFLFKTNIVLMQKVVSTVMCTTIPPVHFFHATVCIFSPTLQIHSFHLVSTGKPD